MSKFWTLDNPDSILTKKLHEVNMHLFKKHWHDCKTRHAIQSGAQIVCYVVEGGAVKLGVSRSHSHMYVCYPATVSRIRIKKYWPQALFSVHTQSFCLPNHSFCTIECLCVSVCLCFAHVFNHWNQVKNFRNVTKKWKWGVTCKDLWGRNFHYKWY